MNKSNLTPTVLAQGASVFLCVASILCMGSILWSAPVALAQPDQAHGGNALVCFKKGFEHLAGELSSPKNGKGPARFIPTQYIKYIKSVEAVELVNARLGVYGKAAMKSLAPLPGEEAEAYATRIQNRFSFWTRSIDEVLRKGQKMIEDRVARVPRSSGSFLPVNDFAPVLMATNGCVYATIAKQVTVGRDSLRTLFIDKDIFDNPAIHSVQSQGVILLHERFLAYLTEKGANDSLGAQALTALSIAQDVTLQRLAEIYHTYVGTDLESDGQLTQFQNFVTDHRNEMIVVAGQAIKSSGVYSLYRFSDEFLLNYEKALNLIANTEFEKELVSSFTFHTRNSGEFFQNMNSANFVTNIVRACKKMRGEASTELSAEDCILARAFLTRVNEQAFKTFAATVPAAKAFVEKYSSDWTRRKNSVFPEIQKTRWNLSIEDAAQIKNRIQTELNQDLFSYPAQKLSDTPDRIDWNLILFPTGS